MNGALCGQKAHFVDPGFTALTSSVQANVANSLLGFWVSAALIGRIIGSLLAAGLPEIEGRTLEQMEALWREHRI